MRWAGVPYRSKSTTQNHRKYLHETAKKSSTLVFDPLCHLKKWFVKPEEKQKHLRKQCAPGWVNVFLCRRLCFEGATLVGQLLGRFRRWELLVFVVLGFGLFGCLFVCFGCFWMFYDLLSKNNNFSTFGFLKTARSFLKFKLFTKEV